MFVQEASGSRAKERAYLRGEYFQSVIFKPRTNYLFHQRAYIAQ